MNILKLKLKILPAVFIILLLCSCCVRIEFDSKKKKSIRNEVEEIFSKLITINFDDFPENFDDNVKNLHEWVKKYGWCGGGINSRTDYLYKVVFDIGNIKEGNTVVDLGSGFGTDCILLRQVIIGDKGKVIGVDIYEPYNVLTRKYSEYLGFDNIDFILGDIRELPLDNNIADVVISNYTLTLIAEKEKVFSEIFRVLKNGGNCYIGDAIIYGNNFDLLEKINNDTLYADYYINRSIREEEYLEILKRIGFKNIKIKVTNYCGIDDKGRVLCSVCGCKLCKFRFRKKAITAGVYIYAEK